jgi:steroid delta-isomerase-like uncharacterized protein
MTDAVATSTERNTHIAVRYFEMLDRHDFEAADSMLSPDFKLYFSNLELDREQMKAFVRSAYDAFADLRHDIHETLAVGDRVVIRCTDRGTHTGDFEGTPASGRQIAIGQITILRIVGDQIAEIREEADMLLLMQQIGAIPT